MKDLTPTQRKLMQEIHQDIANAKAHETYEDYVKANYKNNTPEDIEREIKKQTYKHFWEENLNNIALTKTSTNTLKALEKKGYIQIIEIGNIDKVKVLK
jgi:DNA-binding MarR family transcriptional regulator